MEILKKAKKEQITQNHVLMEVADIGQQNESYEIEKIRDFCPTVIVLAFCWSEKSELNDILRSAGIYTAMVLREERAQITESRHVELDEGQKDFIRTIAEKKPRNIFLWGSTGTGKTLLLIEALLMKISQYRREGRQLDIIVTAFWSSQVLIKNFRENYLSSLAMQDNVTIVDFQVLCQKQDVEYNYRRPQSTLASLLPRLAASPPLTLLLVDETFAGEGDWASFQPCKNLDFMIALAPWDRISDTVHQVTPPADQQLILSRRLLTPHRNCHQIRQFNLFILHHHNKLSLEEDVAAPLLPPGRLPLWVQKTEEESDVSVLEMLKEEYTNSLSVTVIYMLSESYKEVEVWCQEKGWRYVKEANMNGSEDECVVLLGDGIIGILESISRGRNMLVVVTTRGTG